MEFNNYMGKFTTSGEVQTAISNGDLLNPYVALVGGEIDFNSLKGYKETPLTFEILSGGTICWKANNSAYTVTLEYSKNGGEWTSITSNTGTSAPTITVESGDTVQFRGNNATLATNGSRYNTFSGTSCGFRLYGNIMSLLNKNNFSTVDMLQSTYTFKNLFYECRGMEDASGLQLPATTLSNYCYSYMFYNCRNLTSAPKLPATTLTQSCYQSMFYNCRNLTSAPKLPATTLAQGCYESMFAYCTSLATAPELPATTLANSCYYGMFQDANVLPDCSNIDFTSATVIASGGLQGLFRGTKVTDNDLRQILPINPSTNNYYLPLTTLGNNCYKSMFEYCRSLTTAPELPATTLASNCYSNMFSNCASLTTASELPATTLTDLCYFAMFNGCTSLTTAPELPATTLTTWCYQYMFSGCSSLNYIKCLATDISATNCLTNWVSGVASTGTFVKDSSMTSWTEGNNGIPTGWTIQDNV